MTYETYAKIMTRINEVIATIEESDEQFDNLHDECAEALKCAQELHDATAAAVPAYYAAWQEEVSNAKDCAEMGPIDPHGIFNYQKLVVLEKQFGIDNSNSYNGPEHLVDEATQQQARELADKLDDVWKHYKDNFYDMSPEDKVDEYKICVYEEEELCKQYPNEIASLALLMHRGPIPEPAPAFGATAQQ